ncbi:HupE/UreJ family protein [Pontibacterium sp. N1Y112]|uniref:HupE/UreJ family protein n=1 Tax=Pontibacterium sinense TaxID=2781979 RepID=A0A8J7FDF5_9GAMM|nr:HupE/UreJ family protein [Pontibacterium sinense]MBE9397384.1 HupE/UreJ family protein [Pontibacterium sinense]
MKLKVATAASLLALSSTPAFAHTASVAEHSSLLSGLVHPLVGVDHLLAMLAVGFWAAMQKNKLRLQIPMVFMLVLIAGFMLGQTAFNLPIVEAGIATSVLMLGLLIATAARLPTAVALGLSGGFALFHGYAHGAEAATSSMTLFAAGFLGSSLMLHLCGGMAANTVKTQLPALAKLAGLAIAAAGATLLAA